MKQPHWPAIIKHDEDHELVLIFSEQDWLENDELNRFPFSDNDYLVDSQGQLFKLNYYPASRRVHLEFQPAGISLDDFSQLVRKHLCTLNECCISKVTVTSYQQGLELIISASGSQDL